VQVLNQAKPGITLVLLRCIEVDGVIRRGLAVLKIRGS